MRPIIAITMGDPASIGPEITLRALAKQETYKRCKPLVIGDACVLENAREYVGLQDLRINKIIEIEDALYQVGTIDVLDMKAVDIEKLKLGEVSSMAGDASFRYVRKAIQLAMSGKVRATVTNAINKEAINMAGHHYAGHTEIYAHFTNTKNYTMMLTYHNLRVVHVSTHVSLREACDLVKKDRILEVIKIAESACKDMGIQNPKIGIAGLNPHCGENGLFGREETEEIVPAVEQGKELGIYVEGPIPPDTIFSKALGGWYDIVIAMYHDQGHIPLKVVGFVYDDKGQKWEAVEGVNCTLGLPIIRTSVDHGTAYDQAGKGTAIELSLENAIDYAVKFAE